MNIRLFKPSVFQGSLKNKNYFEGWYFKQVSKSTSHTYSIIPGISLVKNDPHAFIQIVDGQNGYTEYIRYPIDKFRWETKSFYIRVGSSVFSDQGMMLDIRSEKT